MAGELRRASEALDQRKVAALGMQEADGEAHLVGPATVAAVFSGFDLDPAELQKWEAFMAGHGIGLVVEDGCPLGNAAASCWLDGLAMGLLIAEARDREAAAR